VTIIIIQFHVYVRAALNCQQPITESARIQMTNIRRENKQIRKKQNQLKLFILQCKFLKISIDIQTTLAAEAR
jgi:hypothetical protein